MVRRCVWPRNLVNEEVLDCWRLSRQKQTNHGKYVRPSQPGDRHLSKLDSKGQYKVSPYKAWLHLLHTVYCITGVLVSTMQDGKHTVILGNFCCHVYSYVQSVRRPGKKANIHLFRAILTTGEERLHGNILPCLGDSYRKFVNLSFLTWITKLLILLCNMFVKKLLTSVSTDMI
jgi:hypothetical protein